METKKNVIGSLFEQVEDYSKTTYKLSKLKSIETGTIVITELVSRLSVIILVSLFALVFNIGIALLLGELLGKNYYGFFIVAGFYLLAGIIVHFFLHKWIKKPLSELIIIHALQ